MSPGYSAHPLHHKFSKKTEINLNRPRFFLGHSLFAGIIHVHFFKKSKGSLNLSITQCIVSQNTVYILLTNAMVWVCLFSQISLMNSRKKNNPQTHIILLPHTPALLQCLFVVFVVLFFLVCFVWFVCVCCVVLCVYVFVFLSYYQMRGNGYHLRF